MTRLAETGRDSLDKDYVGVLCMIFKNCIPFETDSKQSKRTENTGGLLLALEAHILELENAGGLEKVSSALLLSTDLVSSPGDTRMNSAHLDH